ncbi:unnamed protein product, partial [Pylaiella littoralis]
VFARLDRAERVSSLSDFIRRESHRIVFALLAMASCLLLSQLAYLGCCIRLHVSSETPSTTYAARACGPASISCLSHIRSSFKTQTPTGDNSPTNNVCHQNHIELPYTV